MKDIRSTSLEHDTVSFKKLEPGKSVQVDYSIKESSFQKLLDVQEFISTSNNPREERHTLKAGTNSDVYFRIAVTNVSNIELTDIEITKSISPGFTKVQISNASSGAGNLEENIVVWTIPALGAHAGASFEFHMTAKIPSIDTTLKSGAITLSYQAPRAVSGLGIAKFEAHSNNRFFIKLGEVETKPGTFDCQLIFQNTSEFMVRIVNIDVFDTYNASKKLVGIIPLEMQRMPAGSEWISKKWQYIAPQNKEPAFRKQCEFFLDVDSQVRIKGAIYLEDIVLTTVP